MVRSCCHSVSPWQVPLVLLPTYNYYRYLLLLFYDGSEVRSRDVSLAAGNEAWRCRSRTDMHQFEMKQVLRSHCRRRNTQLVLRIRILDMPACALFSTTHISAGRRLARGQSPDRLRQPSHAPVSPQALRTCLTPITLRLWWYDWTDSFTSQYADLRSKACDY